MIVLGWFLQTLAVSLACLGMWRIWLRVQASAPRLMLLVIAGGFLFRALAGCALFWISYLGLPLGRAFQLGRGFWFFAFDGMGYFDLSSGYAWNGLRAIAAVPANAPSPFYVQLLALFEYAFGIVASVGILLNVLCYLGMASILVWLSRRDERLQTPAIVALLVLSFAPGSALWSLQPLKDSFFVCVLTGFVATCVAWQDLWASGERPRFAARAIALAALMFVVVYAVSSVRWYTAFALLLTLPLFALGLWAATRRFRALFATIGLMIVCSQAIVFASSAYIPPQIKNLLRPGTAPQGSSMRAVSMLEWLEQIRRGFDLTPGNTAITAGTLVPKRGGPDPAVAALAAPPAATPVPAVTPAPAPTATPVPTPAAVTAAAPTPAPVSAASASNPVSAAAAPATATPAPAPAPVAAAPAPQPKPQTVWEEMATANRAKMLMEQSARMPTSRTGRIVTGMAATFLPRAVAQRLGLIVVEGGRGFWLVADADTVVLDALLIFVIVFCIRSFRRTKRVAPAMLLVLVSTIVIGGPIIYTVSNFGTLFRLRQIIVLLLCLVPLVMTLAPRRAVFDTPEAPML